MIPVPDTFRLMQQQQSFFGKLTSLVFDSSSTGKEASKANYVTSALIQLHSRVTTLILLCGLLLLSLNEYFGETISCLQSDSSLPIKLIERYCWFEGNFVFYDENSVKPSDGKQSPTALQHAYPGVGSSSEGEHKFPLKYYQWVYWVLIIQSILFYLPKFHWDSSEGKQLAQLTEMLNKKFGGSSNLDDEELGRVAQEVYDALIMGARSLKRFIYSEIFCLLHLAVEIWFINVFLNGQFIKLGYQWLTYDSEQLDNRDDPLIRVFPRLSKCQFHKYGFSGSIETHDALCFLGLNIVNEKLYLVLWFWLLFLGFFTLIFLTIRLIYFSVPALRNQYLHVHAPSLNKSIGFQLSRSTGPWFVTRFLISNMKPCNFAELMEIVYKKHFELNLEQRRRWVG